jgi:signal transduction histidine kinase
VVSHPAFQSPSDEPGREPGDPALLDLAVRLRGRGDAESATLAHELEAAARTLAEEKDALERRIFESLAVNHDVNNALVGIFGNAQLLGLGPAAQLPGVADRLAVITREANRIKQAALRIAELKQGLVLPRPKPDAGGA